MVNILEWLKSAFSSKPTSTAREAYLAEQEQISEPWACFEVMNLGVEGDRIKVEFHWNAAFIEELHRLGVQAETEEDSVQLFFYASQMRPTEMSIGDEAVQSIEHPTLSQPQNVLRT